MIVVVVVDVVVVAAAAAAAAAVAAADAAVVAAAVAVDVAVGCWLAFVEYRSFFIHAAAGELDLSPWKPLLEALLYMFYQNAICLQVLCLLLGRYFFRYDGPCQAKTDFE